MNNLQLFLTIGVPTFAVLLAWLSNRSDIHRLADRIDKVSERMDKVSEKIDAQMIALRREVHDDFVAFRKEITADLLLLHERVVRVETNKETISSA